MSEPFSQDALRSDEVSMPETVGSLTPSEEVRTEIIGQSVALQHTLKQIEVVAPTDATVLILGETGTGKELIARAIHRRSRRRDKPLVRVNCTSIPKELFESEFFGHTRGAFTGAIKDRAGRFEAAAGGTLFLDEIGDIPLELQSKLLRVLQEKCYERRRERENVCAVLQKAGWKIRGINGAAELLGVKPTTLISRMEKMGLKRSELLARAGQDNPVEAIQRN
jgi:transcriptional regulator with GAF, ATPase, and Fis domain